MPLNGGMDQDVESSSFIKRMKARVPYFRERLQIVEPVTGSFVKVPVSIYAVNVSLSCNSTLILY